MIYKESMFCFPCPPGSYCPKKSSQPIKCPRGKYSPGGLTECFRCPCGKYTNTEGFVWFNIQTNIYILNKIIYN